MEKIHFDDNKIKEYAKIQANLYNLEPNSSDEALDNLIKEIPPNYLAQKEELMMICQLFAQFSRNCIRTIRGNVIKLFERILTPIKTHIPNEPAFFWKIFGGLFYFKLWFYNEGLITFEEILASTIKDDSPLATEYFLPEIIEKAPEIFEREIKFHIKCQYSNEYLSSFKELRQKHFKWVRECGDCSDPSYREIETDQLRLCIKTDDVDTFQKILSNSGKSINTKIKESTLENFEMHSKEFSLIDFAITFNSINIIKFLLMNNVELEKGVDFTAILTRDNEIIHLIESQMTDQFREFSLVDSIACWNNDMIEYSIQNYDFDFLEKSDIGEEYDSKVLNIFNQTVVSKNFVFFESILLPFLRKNPSIVDRHFHDFAMNTFDDLSCFFIKIFLEFPDIDINYHCNNDSDHTFLSKSIMYKNLIASEIILKNENLLINDFTLLGHTAFQIACLGFPNVKILRLISEIDGFDINARCSRYPLTALDLSAGVSNFLAIDFITNKFDDCKIRSANLLISRFLSNNCLYSLKLLMEYYIKQNKLKCNDIIKDFRNNLDDVGELEKERIKTLRNIICEITGEDAKHTEEEDDVEVQVDEINKLLELIRLQMNKKDDDEDNGVDE